MAFGDTALRTLAQRLSSQQVQHQFFARIHSDTFALLLTNLSGTLEQASAQAASSIENVLAQIAQPLQVHQQTLHLSAGAGVVMIPNDSQDPPELLREAETAMHLSKAAGDNRVPLFCPCPARGGQRPAGPAQRFKSRAAHHRPPRPKSCCCTTSRKSMPKANCTGWKPWCAGTTPSKG